MPSEHSKPIRLARTALVAAIDGRNEASLDTLRRLWQECGADGMALAMQAWCDSFIDHATEGDPRPRRVRLGFVNSSTGAFDRDGSEQVPADVQWAGRLIQARAAMDRQAYEAVVAELPEGESDETGRCLAALLHVVAATVRSTPRGYALMGRAVSDG